MQTRDRSCHVVIALALLLLAGCPALDPNALHTEAIVGGNDERTLLSKTDFTMSPGGLGLLYLLNPEPLDNVIHTVYVAYEAGSGRAVNVQPPLNTVNATGYTDGVWFVEQHDETGEIGIVDMRDATNGVSRRPTSILQTSGS